MCMHHIPLQGPSLNLLIWAACMARQARLFPVLLPSMGWSPCIPLCAISWLPAGMGFHSRDWDPQQCGAAGGIGGAGAECGPMELHSWDAALRMGRGVRTKAGSRFALVHVSSGFSSPIPSCTAEREGAG